MFKNIFNFFKTKTNTYRINLGTVALTYSFTDESKAVITYEGTMPTRWHDNYYGVRTTKSIVKDTLRDINKGGFLRTATKDPNVFIDYPVSAIKHIKIEYADKFDTFTLPDRCTFSDNSNILLIKSEYDV
jgi:hypothetical protein